MRKALWLIALLLPVSARAANFPISAGASVATINSTIATAAAASGGNTVTFAAGSYSINGTVTVPCPVSSLTIQGPVIAYRAPASLLPASYSYSTPYTANLNGSLASGSGWNVSSNGCSQQITIQGFNWNGGQPSGGGGGWVRLPAGASNVTVQFNYVHGNWASVTTGHTYDDSIDLEGNGVQTPIDVNIKVLWNVFGDGSSDCNPIMNLTTYQGGQYSSAGGLCGGVGIHVSTTNLVIQNNAFEHLEQPMKFFESPGGAGDIVHTFMANNVLVDHNDCGQWHRICLEAQQDVVANNTTGSVFNVTNNSSHDAIDPSNGLFAISVPQCCSNFHGYTGNGVDNQSNVDNNVLISNSVATSNWTAYANEWWSTGHSNNNLFQGYWSYLANGHVNGGGGAIGYGFTNTTFRTWFANNNICQFPDGTGICIANEEGSTPAPNQSGNTTSNPSASRTSFAPTISPAAGPQSFPLTVTFTDPGYTSGGGPQGNTGIWYTADGSTPTPGSGTAKRVDSGGSIVLLTAATVKAVGMWGAANQPAVYPSGYGFVPSAAVTSAFTSSGFFISPTGNDANAGTSGSPWLTPNHALTCGATITALPGTYAATNFQNGDWGTVTCPGANNVVWLACQTFDTCKISSSSTDGMWVDKSFWGVQGWEVSVTGGTSGACFHFGPSGTTSVHHVIFANDVANGCKGGGFNAYSKPGSTTASVDYVTYLGDVAYNAAGGTSNCYSGFNIYQPIASDAASGTHMYIAGSFSYSNTAGSPCSSGLTADGEGINLNTFDFSQGGGTAYTQQAVVQNNISVNNGSSGILVENNKVGGSAPTYVKQNTTYGNMTATNLSSCTGLGELFAEAAFNVTETGNIAMTSGGTGCMGDPIFAASVTNGNGTVSVAGNWLYSAAGNTTLATSSPGFSFGSNTTGTNPAFTGSSTTINAASCTASAVQTAFNSITSATTTVNIPSCAGQNWTTQVTLTVPSGSTTLSVVGAGSLSTPGGGDITNIVDAAATGNTPILLINATNSGSLFRLAGITFKGGAAGTGNDKFDGMVQFQGSTSKIRVDHVHFNTSTYSPALASSALQFNGCTYGVVDHSIFDNASGSVNNSIRAYNQGSCYSDSLGIGDQAWAHPTNFGTANFIYAENNTFNSGAADDCTDGGSFVMRFNAFNMTSPPPTTQTHPTGGAGRIRGCRAEEVYQNTMTANPSNYINADLWISSGAALVWGNTIPSSATGGGTGYKNFIELLSMRTSNSTYTQTATPNGWGYCGTAFNGTGSNWDGNTPSAVNGYPCLDQPGRGQGDLLTGGFSADGSGSNNVTNNATSCTSGSACAYPRQALEPIYEWLDVYSPVPSNPSNFLSVNSGTFANNTDYYLWCNASSQSGCTSFTGATGVGSGVLASRPSTCTTGVGYWATDQGLWNQSGSGGQGLLYKCTSTNTWTLSYTPFTYPHPLVATGGPIVIPGAPSCGSAANVPNCMATMVATFTPTAVGSTTMGYQAPSNTSITDVLFPSWLCAGTGVLNPSIPANLITPGCGGGVTPTLTGGHQANVGPVNMLAVGAAAVQQTAVGNYSDGSSQNMPDTFGNTAVWSSSAPSVLNVGSTGLITCLTAGPGSSLVQSSPGGVHFNQWDWTCSVSGLTSGLPCKGGTSPTSGLPGPGGTAPTQGLACHP